ncbi:Hypothetical predicted protein [Pelobates cultripes]|uniref:Uncharacterized protein n=1 Tax=Pelobates cultripes TaxID=61616 RepID=A0AAD1SPQ5_PELCU|nr:Hypothetical predicted protein [Pelobates cultripes]
MAWAKRQTPKRAGERGHMQPMKREKPLGAAPERPSTRTIHDPLQPSDDPSQQPYRHPVPSKKSRSSEKQGLTLSHNSPRLSAADSPTGRHNGQRKQKSHSSTRHHRHLQDRPEAPTTWKVCSRWRRPQQHNTREAAQGPMLTYTAVRHEFHDQEAEGQDAHRLLRQPMILIQGYTAMGNNNMPAAGVG